MECRITILCENTVHDMGFLGEHGFSAYVEVPGHNFLFDTGQGFGIIQNSLRLEKDLTEISKVVLSHGHIDHTGGLLTVLEARGGCPVAAHPDVFNERYRLLTAPGDEVKTLSLGMPWPRKTLEARGAQFELYRDFTEIARNVFVTGEVPRRTLFELGSPKFVVPGDDGWLPDSLRDDLSLVLKTSRGLVVVLGCAHAGMVNILNHAIERTGDDRVYAVLGGTHLGLSPEPQLDPTLEALKRYRIRILAVSHCTGQAPAARLASEFGDRFAFGRVGFSLEV